MPTYPFQPIPLRLQLKSLTRDFLILTLSSEDEFEKKCVFHYTIDDQPRITYGVPMELSVEYRRWAVGVLRETFGQNAVPRQSWEETAID
jgi:hypothetical protein